MVLVLWNWIWNDLWGLERCNSLLRHTMLSSRHNLAPPLGNLAQCITPLCMANSTLALCRCRGPLKRQAVPTLTLSAVSLRRQVSLSLSSFTVSFFSLPCHPSLPLLLSLPPRNFPHKFCLITCLSLTYHGIHQGFILTAYYNMPTFGKYFGLTL